jgi:hypothetical protein
MTNRTDYEHESPADVLDVQIFNSPRYAEYARNSLERYEELERIVETLRVLV